MLKSVAYIIVILTLCANCAKSQFVYFDRVYGTEPLATKAEGIWGNNLIELEDGYLFASISMDLQTLVTGLLLVRTDLEGIKIWDTVHVDENYLEYYNNVISSGDGNYIIASAATELTSVQEDTKAGLTKFNVDGHVIWKYYYGSDTVNENGQNVIMTSDGGFALAGQQGVIPNTDADMLLIRTDSEGVFLWSRTYGGGNFEAAHSLIQTPDSGFLLLGWTRSFGAGQRDFYLVKTDSLGNQLWQRTYGGGGDEIGWGIINLSDGNYVLTGMGSQGSNGSIGRVYKVDSYGEVIWAKSFAYQDNFGNNLYNTVELPNGELASTGLTDRFNNNNSGWLLKTDSNGNVLWQREYDFYSETDLFYTLISTLDGGFLLGGQAIYGQPQTQDAWLLKVDSVGCPYADCLVGIDENERTKVVADVWPNPASQHLNIEWQKAEAAAIAVLDLTGKEVLRISSREKREMIDVSQLANGLYVLQLVQGEAKSSLKVVVQH